MTNRAVQFVERWVPGRVVDDALVPDLAEVIAAERRDEREKCAREVQIAIGSVMGVGHANSGVVIGHMIRVGTVSRSAELIAAVLARHGISATMRSADLPEGQMRAILREITDLVDAEVAEIMGSGGG